MKEQRNNHPPSPEDLQKLQVSITTLTNRGAVRAETRDLLRVLENGNSWGLPKDDVDASIKALRGFMGRPYLFREDIEDMVKVFEEERKFAHIDWAERRQALGDRIRKARGITIRLAAAALCVGGLYFLGDFIYDRYQASHSPEAIAQREIENQQKQEANRIKQDQKRQEQIDVENTHTLGLTPSIVSAKGFRIRYNPVDKNTQYVESGGFFTVAKGESIDWKQKDNNSTKTIETEIYVNAYTRASDGKKIAKLSSRVGSETSGFGTKNIEETWYLRDQSTEEVDSSVVVFEDTKNQRMYYLSINPISDSSSIQVKLMKPESVSNPTDQ